MESISAWQLMIFATHRRDRFPSLPVVAPTQFPTRSRRFRFLFYSKQSAFQDFRGYANPSRLLPATIPQVVIDSSLEKLLASFKTGGPECLYKVKIRTSSIYGSELSDLNAGILVCLIDENGDSILQRIPASSTTYHFDQSEEQIISDVLHFQRGSTDEFTFKGPRLGKIDAIWISPESGQWRLGGVSLIVACCGEPTSETNARSQVEYSCCEYRFKVEDILLGEGSDMSMAEARPCLSTEFSEDNINLLGKNLLQSTATINDVKASEESMREYADLKLSLLLYDALIVIAGSSVASFTAGENAAIGFLTGGIGGFLYLLLLQRSVDGLPSPTLTSMNGTGKLAQILRRLKGPVSGLLLAFIFSAAAVKYGLGDSTMVLTPEELMFGTLGFLACKVAVVLAALKPLQTVLEENK
ncbi:hypothetical protein NMG60_11017817 [Bertholletia excelsa]